VRAAWFLLLTLAAPAARAEVVVQPRAVVGASTPVGDASRVSDAAIDLGLGATLGRVRGRVTLTGRRALGVGDDASLTFFRGGLGIDARVWRNLIAALEIGPAFRRVAVGDEITRTTIGPAAALELGWRFRPSARWSVTPSVQWTSAWYSSDLLLFWHDVGLVVAIERLAP
jgi:hypothetical protein